MEAQTQIETRSKRKIVENAISLFSENGYEGTTLNQIANSVDIKKASLYYHYASKEEIYRSCVNACINYFTTFIEETKKTPFIQSKIYKHFYMISYLISMKNIFDYTYNSLMHLINLKMNF